MAAHFIWLDDAPDKFAEQVESLISVALKTPLDGLYFSSVTMMILSYGDAVLLAMSRLGGHNIGHSEKTALPEAKDNQPITGS